MLSGINISTQFYCFDFYLCFLIFTLTEPYAKGLPLCLMSTSGAVMDTMPGVMRAG